MIERNYISVFVSIFFILNDAKTEQPKERRYKDRNRCLFRDMTDFIYVRVCVPALNCVTESRFFHYIFFTFSEMLSSLLWTANSAAFSKHGLALGVLSSFVV